MTNLLYGEDMAASEDAMVAEIVHGFSGADSSQSFDSSSRRKIESIATNGWNLHDEASNMSAKGKDSIHSVFGIRLDVASSLL